MSDSENVTTSTNVCYIHPDRETMLRCNRCDRPICTQCAVLTPTGYRCKNCVRGQLKVFETAQWYDYPLSFITAAALSFIGSLIASYLGFFTIFIAPVVGVITAEAVRSIVRKRRSKLLFRIATAGIIAGALPRILTVLLVAGGGSMLFGLLWPGLYMFLVASTAYYRMSGITIR
jgi:hypothetical protein